MLEPSAASLSIGNPARLNWGIVSRHGPNGRRSVDRLRARGRARTLLWIGGFYAFVGVAGALLIHYAFLISVLILPVMIWYARRVANKGLLLTTSGVVWHLKFVPWSEVRKVDSVEEEREREDGSKYRVFFLTFDHGDFDPLRCGLTRPSPEELQAVARVCRERGVEVGFRADY